MPRNKGLGRGLDAIFGDNSIEDSFPVTETSELSISLIDPNANQPRKNFDNSALADLAESINNNGVLQPILVRKLGERYEIIAGERRFRASMIAGKTTIPAKVIEATDFEAAKYALIENLQREDLNPYEEAQSYAKLMKEYNLSQEDIAAQVGKSRPAISNSLRLLELPEDIAQLLIDGKLTQGHARTLLGLRDRSLMAALAERCIKRNLSVRELEQSVKNANKAIENDDQTHPIISRNASVNYITSLETRFTETTGRRCKITEKKNNKVFSVEYHDNDDLCEILKKLAGDSVLKDF